MKTTSDLDGMNSTTSITPSSSARSTKRTSTVGGSKSNVKVNGSDASLTEEESTCVTAPSRTQTLTGVNDEAASFDDGTDTTRSAFSAWAESVALERRPPVTLIRSLLRSFTFEEKDAFTCTCVSPLLPPSTTSSDERIHVI